jgi:hypothetical protein
MTAAKAIKVSKEHSLIETPVFFVSRFLSNRLLIEQELAKNTMHAVPVIGTDTSPPPPILFPKMEFLNSLFFEVFINSSLSHLIFLCLVFYPHFFFLQTPIHE